MTAHYENIQDFARRNLSFTVVTYSAQNGNVKIGIVQGANSRRFRVVRLEGTVVTDDLQVSNFERATGTFEGMVQDENRQHV